MEMGELLNFKVAKEELEASSRSCFSVLEEYGRAGRKTPVRLIINCNTD